MARAPIIFSRYRDMALNLDVIYRGKSPGAFPWSVHYWCMTSKAPQILKLLGCMKCLGHVDFDLTASDESVKVFF